MGPLLVVINVKYVMGVMPVMAELLLTGRGDVIGIVDVMCGVRRMGCGTGVTTDVGNDVNDVIHVIIGMQVLPVLLVGK